MDAEERGLLVQEAGTWRLPALLPHFNAVSVKSAAAHAYIEPTLDGSDYWMAYSELKQLYICKCSL